MNNRDKRLAHAYAVRELRRLGRELTAGSWSRAGGAMSAAQAAVVMSRAMIAVFEVGLTNVRDALDAKVDELLADLLHPS